YARCVYTDGRDLHEEDFKRAPDGHTGGSLNMVPAYVGYLAANTISGLTRSWLMGQGHCVAAVDSVNLLVDNMSPAHAERYDLSDEGLTRFVRDFYSYAITPEGKPESPRGSHVNPHTAGGLIEGGYLGFAELLYPHMPLPGERLVAFLSDGAFEEQRGSEWASRWWRARDSGLVAPIMISNGRRIDERTTMAQGGGPNWFRRHLRLNGFDPIEIDGRDPSAFAWVIIEMESRLSLEGRAVESGQGRYPVQLPYAIAEAPKGYGFPGQGTNLAHNLPLGENPAFDVSARGRFNSGARRLWVPMPEINRAVGELNNHDSNSRPKEKDHPLARRNVPTPVLPEPGWKPAGSGDLASPMAGIDLFFCRILQANPYLHPRVGNPDEMRSNRLNATLDLLKHRVTDPEAGVAEHVYGSVITALNEEAVVSAALGNKGGISLVASYEAFAVKMLGAIRQELIFARHQRDVDRAPGWLSVPVLLSSHTWENGKNEQSHQDPTLAEALMAEMTDVSRVLFPADWNSALASLRAVYSSHGQIWTLVVPKNPVPVYFSPEQALNLVKTGAIRVRGAGAAEETVLLVASGAYQLGEALRASDRLADHGISHSVVYLLEPGRFRSPRDEREQEYLVPEPERAELFPASAGVRVFLTHTRPEPFFGIVRPLDTGVGRTRALGYINHGGTLDTPGMLFANRCTWAHALQEVATGLDIDPTSLLAPDELGAVRGEASPASVMARA
ncbi:MAG: xylulose 5-phosphate 3-epimerase, partial [Chloroflexota bacterium]|nr:xylulose 5-phosphate 3-epimerase [Chloroflexota bacterium]